MSVTVCITPLTLGCPGIAGHLWVYLNWALSLHALGCRVIWLEDIGELASAAPRAEVDRDIAELAARLESYGLEGALALTGFDRNPLEPDLAERALDLEAAAHASDLLLDFAYDTPAEALQLFPRTALVDLDPGLLQLWMTAGDLDVSAHDAYFTIGETVGTDAARFPSGGVRWQYTAPPVFLPAWPQQPPPANGAGAYTTVTNWWGGEWIEFEGDSISNEKRDAFLPFADLPSHTDARLELAMTLDEYTASTDRPMLEEHGWSVRDAWEACPTPERYRDYVQRSRAEFSCAKPSCRMLANAWVSDRTICYLASGRPAVVEHTGASRILPDGDGLFRFRDLEEAVAAIAAVEADYERHCRRARELAEERFDGVRIVADVLERALP